MTESLYARVSWDDSALSESQIEGMTVEVGFGPADTAPSDSGWEWAAAQLNPSCPDCNDSSEFVGFAPTTEPGDFLWAARVRYEGSHAIYCDRTDGPRLGSFDDWSAENAPSLTVASSGVLEVATVNLRCLIDDWATRLPILADGLASVSADLLGLQEVCADEAADSLTALREALVDSDLEYQHAIREDTHRSWDSYDEGIAVLSTNRFAEREIVNLPEGELPRKAIMARIATSLGPVVFVTTHLDHRRGADRRLQMEAVLAAVDEFVRAGEVVLVSGDLNEQDGAVARTLENAGFTELWTVLEGSSGPTFPSDDPSSRIDQFWLRAGSSEVRAEEIRRFLTDDVEGVWASDHLGVSVELVFP